MKFLILGIVLCSLIPITGSSQESISSEDFKPFAIYFSLTDDHEIKQKAKDFLINAIADNQFIGLAEVHQSQQLSYFTIGFLDILRDKGFDRFGLELGPNSAKILQKISREPPKTSNNIKMLNQKYGKNSFPEIPLIFVDKVEDALFVKRASELGFEFWGLDQEFSYAYEMLLDELFLLIDNPNEELTDIYQRSKEILRRNIFKNKISGKTKNCWLLDEPTIDKFFDLVKENPDAQYIIASITKSWNIYCRNESGLPSNQLRADYMINNFDSLYNVALERNDLPKVFIKLGGVHLTRGVSVFGVNDIGQHLTVKGQENQTGFLTIRHLSKYRNGKNVTGKKGWKGLEILMSLGEKDLWTIVDLRPIRQKLDIGELKASEKIAFEVYNYDLLLIPPDDRKAKLNY